MRSALFLHTPAKKSIPINRNYAKGDNAVENMKIYEDIAARTGGDVYVGVVGPVRT